MRSKSELLALVADLRQYDHDFLTVEGARAFSEPFGFTAHTYVMKDDRDNPKGLALNSGPGTSAEGVDAADLAEQICHQLNVPYGSAMGRGFRLRYACDALEKHLSQQEKTT